MVFDGAAYYGLPSATQASTSGSQKPAPAATTHPYRGNAQNTNNIIYNNKQSSRGIIQRPYSYESSQNTYYAGTQPSQGFQQPWHGQAPLYGQMWQHQSIQPYDLNMHSRGGQSVQHAPAPPLPPGPPPPAPPPLLRHALPPKPQAAFFPPNNARAASLPRPDAHELPAVLKPMRQVPEQRPQDYRAQRVGQPDSHFTSNNAHPNVSAKLFCEICKLRFNSTIHLIAHQRNEHVKCCKYDDGCMFEGMPDVVEIHEQDRHLIFRPGARREKTRPDGPPGLVVQFQFASHGTDIFLLAVPKYKGPIYP